MNADRYIIEERGEGFACNIRWVTIDRETGRIAHRGPEWACSLRASEYNAGRAIDSMNAPNGGKP